MLSRLALLLVLSILFYGVAVSRLQAQGTAPVEAPRPSPQATPAERETQDQIRIFTEEVFLPVVAYDDYGHFDPSVEADDLLVLEDGMPQAIKSIRRIPASIILLLGTGSELNPAQRTSTTRSAALRFITNLRSGDRVAVLQFDNHVETLQDWTTDVKQTAHALNTKLHSGKGSRLAQALTEAAAHFKDQPRGNRHIILITDGVDMPVSHPGNAEAIKILTAQNSKRANMQDDITEAFKQLTAAQATVHVISYTSLAKRGEQKRAKGEAGVAQPGSVRASGIERAGIDPTMPPTVYRGSGMGISNGTAITFDPQMHRLHQAYEEALKRSERRLTSLAEETGGTIILPTSTEEMTAGGGDVASEVDAQYVVTYAPKRPFASLSTAEYRRIQVFPRRAGLHVRTERGYVATPAP